MRQYRPLEIVVGFLVLSGIATSASGAELEVAELIDGLKKAIDTAQRTATPPFMSLPWVEGEITYVVKKEGEGGFKLSVVTAEAKYATEAVQRVKFRLEPPGGKPWTVEGPGEIKHAVIWGVDHNARRVFVSEPSWPKNAAIAVKFGPDTKVFDWLGNTKRVADIRAGTEGTVSYSAAPGEEPKLLGFKITSTPKPLAPTPKP